jgi:hypothetical protein
MACLTVTGMVVGGCVLLSIFHDKRWLVAAGAVGVVGYTISMRNRVP